MFRWHLQTVVSTVCQRSRDHRQKCDRIFCSIELGRKICSCRRKKLFGAWILKLGTFGQIVLWFGPCWWFAKDWRIVWKIAAMWRVTSTALQERFWMIFKLRWVLAEINWVRVGSLKLFISFHSIEISSTDWWQKGASGCGSSRDCMSSTISGVEKLKAST